MRVLVCVVSSCLAASACDGAIIQDDEPDGPPATVTAALLDPPADYQCKVVSACIGNVCIVLFNKPNGTACNDNNACTSADACQAGVCVGNAYSCPGDACHTGTCNGSGGCTAANRPDGTACGASCGDGCSCGQCLAGACGAVDVAEADEEATVFPIDLEVQDHDLYALNDVFDESGFDGRVSLVRVADGVTTELVADLGPLASSAIDASNLYFAELDRVSKLSLGGGSAVELVARGSIPPEIGVADAIAVDGTRVYFTSAALGTVSSANLDGTDLCELADFGWPGDVATDGSDLYWLDEPNGLVLRMPVTGGTASFIYSGAPGPWGIALDAGHVYWTNPDEGTVRRVEKDGDNPQVLASGQSNPTAITVTGTRVYWSADAGGSAHVYSVASGGGSASAITVPSAEQSIVALTHDDACVYWASYGGVLRRAPR